MHNWYLSLAYASGLIILIGLFWTVWRYHKKFFMMIFVLAGTASASPQSCPNIPVEQCRHSFKDLVDVVSKCHFQQAKNCTIIFMESLHALDERAPFYSSLFNGFLMQGNLQAYRKVYDQLSDSDKDILFGLSAALALEVKDYFESMGMLDDDSKDEVNGAVALRYRINMKRELANAYPRHIKQFIAQARHYVSFINWPRGARKMQKSIRERLRLLRRKKRRKVDPNDPTPEFSKADYLEFMATPQKSRPAWRQ